MHEHHPVIDAVAVNYNGGERIVSTVRALLAQGRWVRQVYVVDNASTDGSPERLREMFPSIVVHPVGRNAGLTVARNVGMRLTNAKFVLLLDQDMYVADDCVALLSAAQRETGATVVSPRIILFPDRTIIQADGAEAHFVGTMTLRHGFTPVERTPPARAIVPGCSGGTMLLDHEKVLAAGGFDEAYFFYFEDLEFLLRMRTFGHQFVCEERAVVYHDRGVGTVGLSFRGRESYPARRAELVMRNRLLTVFLHYRARTLLVLTPALLAYEAATLCLAVTRGWTVAWLRAWAWQAANRRLILDRRRANAARRVRADRDVLSGGPLPLAEGLLKSPAAHGVVAVFSGALNVYWRLTRWAVG